VAYVHEQSMNKNGSGATISDAEALDATGREPQLVLEVGGHQTILRSLLFTADGSELISVSDDKTIRGAVSDVGRKTHLARTLGGQIEERTSGKLAAVALSAGRGGAAALADLGGQRQDDSALGPVQSIPGDPGETHMVLRA
jgi:hypothetical protein